MLESNGLGKMTASEFFRFAISHRSNEGIDVHLFKLTNLVCPRGTKAFFGRISEPRSSFRTRSSIGKSEPTLLVTLIFDSPRTIRQFERTHFFPIRR